MDRRKIVVGSRESRLAVLQTGLVLEELGRLHPGLDLTLATMKTTGDKILDRPLDQVGGKGLFVKELDQALADGRIDLSVHSLKDMPMEQPEGLPIVAYFRRGDPRDALVLPKGAAELDLSRPIGCSSRRRSLQLKKLFPGAWVESVRGNVLTRLEKLDRGDYSALVLACAGLSRLGLEGRVSRVFSPEELLPAAGQGILAVQGRAGDDLAYLAGVNDPDAQCCALAERAFVRALDGGCSSPVAAYAVPENGGLWLRGLYYGEASGCYEIDEIRGERAAAESMGIALARRMKRKNEL